ncbi:MAG: protein phosphatase 2C domain-containing protein [Eubacterium sp.]|nr:protein phosphatase 2C domain-containing protein [Eubacterium sp.]
MNINHADTVFEEKIKINSSVLTGVFDGLGGEERGEADSYKAAEVLGSYDGKEIDFEEYFNSANREICISSEGIAEKNSGTTAAVLYIDADGFIAANIGDSRIYHIRNNTIKQLTTDHTLTEALISSGVIKREDAGRSKYKNCLTRCLGMYDNVDNMAAVTEKEKLKEGDIFVLCSDGLSGALEDEEILSFLKECKDEKNSALGLTEKAYTCGSKDNTTVIVIYVKKETGLIGRILGSLRR